MSDVNCRLAKLEQWKEDHRSTHIEVKKDVDEFTEKIFTKLDVIESRLDNQKGFIAGITFAVSAIITMLGLGFEWFSKQ